jgi:phosphoadenosine phosphosulfate reductase
MGLMQKLPDLETAAREEALALEARYGHLEPEELIALSVEQFFPDQIATVSSFGNGSAVLLHIIAKIDRTLPVVFLDTGKHFDETLAYRDRLIGELGLTDVSIIKPRFEALAQDDPDGKLHKADTDRCCAIRKVEPMARAVAPWRAWFTGRKRYQASTRSSLQVFEAVGPRVRINPLAAWQSSEMKAYAERNNLPVHPLVAYGYYSIGCLPCTEPARPGEDERSGRWAGKAKIECGIHLSGLEQSLTSSSL